MQWPLILRTGFGNVFPLGRWGHAATVLVAQAYNTGDWSPVEAFARDEEWDDDEAN